MIYAYVYTCRYTKSPMKLGAIGGNHFTIVLRYGEILQLQKKKDQFSRNELTANDFYFVEGIECEII